MIGSKRFLPNCLLSTLLALLLIGGQLCAFARLYALRADTYLTIAEEQKLTDRVMNSLEQHFTTKASATSIPAEVYMEHITREQVDTAIRDTIQNAFSFIHGDTDTIAVTVDLSEMEQSVSDFFSDYAASIGYKKDAAYETKVTATQNAAKQEVIAQVDVFKFATLENAGLLSKAKALMPYLNFALAGCGFGCLILLLLLSRVNRKSSGVLLYWGGWALTISALLPLIPVIYVKKTDYFAAFVIKSDRIYAAVTGSLNGLTDALFQLDLVLLALGLLCVIGYGVLSRVKRPKPEPEQSEQPTE